MEDMPKRKIIVATAVVVLVVPVYLFYLSWYKTDNVVIDSLPPPPQRPPDVNITNAEREKSFVVLKSASRKGFTLLQTKKIASPTGEMKDGYDTGRVELPPNPWDLSLDSFLYGKNKTEINNCGFHLCDYDEHRYDLIIARSEPTGFSLSVSDRFSIATSSADGIRIEIRNIANLKSRPLTGQGGIAGSTGRFIFLNYGSVFWSPDRQYIAFFAQDDKCIFEDAGVFVVRIGAPDFSEQQFLGCVSTQQGDGAPDRIDWSPDSKKLLAGLHNRTVFFVDPRKQAVQAPEDLYFSEWSPASNKIGGWIGDLSHTFSVVDAGNGARLDYLIDENTGRRNISSIAWGPTDNLAILSLGSSIYVVDLEVREVTKIAEVSGEAQDLRWSPDGKYILYKLNGEIWLAKLAVEE